MSKYCTSCGNKVYETFRICPGCGGQSFSSNPKTQITRPPQSRPLGSVRPPAVSGTLGFVAAGNWARLFANIIDVVFYLLVAMLVAFMLGMSIGWSIPDVDVNSVEALGNLSVWVVLVLYFALFHSSKYQATPGKLAAGLRIVTLDGNKVSFGRAVGRACLTIGVYLLGLIAMVFLVWVFASGKQTLAPVDWTLAFLCGFVIWNTPYLMLFFNRERQTLFDRICRTRVVKR